MDPYNLLSHLFTDKRHSLAFLYIVLSHRVIFRTLLRSHHQADSVFNKAFLAFFVDRKHIKFGVKPLVISDDQDGGEDHDHGHQEAHHSYHFVITMNEREKIQILRHKVSHVFPVLFKVVKFIHNCREGGNRQTLKSIEEEGKHHLIPRLLLKIFFVHQRICSC